ncbi:hypothetical protein [Micromonospora narathiwatensis]|uniref:hypothetical protein n=1 Tax=Micromonospora narathiwatensis TaxID=299146 RepID=UPI0038B3AB5B
MPPGLHAPTAERAAAEPPPSLSQGWADRASEPPAEPASHGWADRPSSGPSAEPPSLSQRWADRASSGPSAEPQSRSQGWVDRASSEPSAEPPSRSQGWAERPAPPPAGPPAERDTGPVAERRGPAEEPRAASADDRRVGPGGERGPVPAEEPNWNPPSWGGGWAPRWAGEDEPVGRRASEDEPAGRRSHEDEPAGRRAHAERAAEWAPEPPRSYEAPRSEPSYEAPRSEAAYEAPRSEAAYEASRAEAEPQAGRETRERPSWAGPPVPVTPFGTPPHTTPTSAPPVPREAPGTPATGYDPASTGYAPPGVRPGEARDAGPYRPRGVADEPPAGPPGLPASPAGPAAGGATRFDRNPATTPTSAPPYAARRAAPEPVPPAAQPAEPIAGAQRAEPIADAQPAEPAPAVLPQRVPAEPDVPGVPEPPAVEPSAETPELARIATHLRRDDEPAPPRERPEGFDVNAILDAVREVPGVRDAALRRTPAGAHSLRLDLADGADPAEVSRVVARLLQERMGLAAAPQNLPGAPAVPPPPVRRRPAQPRVGEPRAVEERPGAARTALGRAGENRAPENPATENRAAENRAGEGRFSPPEARTGRVAEAPEGTEPGGEPPRRRRPASVHRGRAAVEESSLATVPASGAATGSPATLGTSYSGGQMTTTETAPSRPLDTGGVPGPRVVIDHVQVSTFGLDATVEVRLIAGDRTADGHSTGPAVDGYVLRLCAVAAAAAVDELLGRAAPDGERGRCFVEHAAVVPFGNCEVATVVVLLVCDGWVEQLAGSALVAAGDPRQAVVRATLAAVNRRLEALLA